MFFPSVLAADAAPPTGLLADLQHSPALGVRAGPSFAWIVPPCDAADDATQTAYQIVVSAVDGHTVWDSKKVQSAVSTDAAYAGPALAGGAWYDWTVTTWSENAAKEACTSAPSTKSSFVTQYENFTEWGAQFIGFAPFDGGALAPTANIFTYARKEITLPFLPSTIVRAAGFVLGPELNALLCGYRFYLNGELVDVGPGRPEARVWGGDGAFKKSPYTTLDLTARMQALPANAPFALAFQLMRGPLVFRATVWLKDGSAYTIVSDGTWSVFNGDVERNLAHSQGGGNSAGVRDGVEFIDARNEPVGWREPRFYAGAAWIAAAATALPRGFDATQISSKMEPPMQLKDIASTKTVLLPPAPAPPAPTPPPSPTPTTPAACVSVGENSIAAIGECSLCTVTFYAYLAHSLTRSP